MIAVFLLIGLLMADVAQAATYYVATTGSDSADGSETTPWLTVKKAVDTMVAGDTTYVRAGTYTETNEVRFARSGTQSSPIRLANYPGESPVIQFSDRENGNHRISIWNSAGQNVAVGWVTIEGLTITNASVGIRIYSGNDITIKNNKIHNNRFHGILGNGTRVVIANNTIYHNGGFVEDPTSTLQHGIYMNGTAITIRNNLIYDNLGFNIQVNGSSSSLYNPSLHAGPEYAVSHDWIIADNTIAYSVNRSGIVVWGSTCLNLRIENNIFYENYVAGTSGNINGIDCVSCGSATGIKIRNNHLYASGSGGQVGIDTTFNADLVSTGNVVNVSAPAFVYGGSNSLPASPDFSLTASSPVNIALANEFLNNSTNVVGAFKTIAAPTPTIHANTVTLTFPMNTAVPIQIPSSAGVSIGCTGANCPGSPTVGSASRKTGTDSQVEVVINGISSDACVATNQNWTITYNSSTGGWKGFDDIGPYPGLHQKVFSFSSLPVTNLCDGTGPPTGPGTPYIHYPFDEGSGTTANNSGSGGSGENGTLTGGASFVAGGGVLLTGSSGQYVAIPEGASLDPSASNFTIAFGIDFPAGAHLLSRTYFGAPIGTNQRLYISGVSGMAAIGVQASNDATPSELLLNSGRNHFCLEGNATANTVTLHVNGVASTQPGGVKSVTSYALSGNFELGRVGGVANGVGGTFSDFRYYQSIESCSAIYAAWNPTQPAVGTFGMPSYRFQAVYLPELGGTPTSFGTAINQPKDVVAGGAVAVLLEAYCENVANCEPDAFRPEAQHNGTGAYAQIQNMATDLYMWGADSNTLLNAGATTSRLSAGSCTLTNGVTVLTSDQVPVIDLPQDGCVVLRYIVRLGAAASGYYNIRLSQQNGTPFTGTVNPARINVIPPQANAGP